MDKPENEDPFVVNDNANKQDELADGFKKSKEEYSDVAAILDDLEVKKNDNKCNMRVHVYWSRRVQR